MKKVTLKVPKSYQEYYNLIDEDCWGAIEVAQRDYKFLSNLELEKVDTYLTGKFYGYGAMREVAIVFPNTTIYKYFPSEMIISRRSTEAA